MTYDYDSFYLVDRNCIWNFCLHGIWYFKIRKYENMKIWCMQDFISYTTAKCRKIVSIFYSKWFSYWKSRKCFFIWKFFKKSFFYIFLKCKHFSLNWTTAAQSFQIKVLYYCIWWERLSKVHEMEWNDMKWKHLPGEIIDHYFSNADITHECQSL